MQYDTEIFKKQILDALQVELNRKFYIYTIENDSTTYSFGKYYKVMVDELLKQNNNFDALLFIPHVLVEDYHHSSTFPSRGSFR